MSEPKHTPGPWKRKDNFVYSPMFDEDDTLSVSIAVACTGIAPAIDNANLIAAAPDMYDKLKGSVILLEVLRDELKVVLEIPGVHVEEERNLLNITIDKINEVLRKARGEE